MLLTPFVAISAFSFGTWILGHYFGWSGVAVIGAVMLLAVGATVTLDGLTIRDGKQIKREFDVVDNVTVNNQTTVTMTVREVSINEEFGGPINSFSLGGLVMIIGGLLAVRHLNEGAM